MAAESMLEKIRKASTIKESDLLSDSKFINGTPDVVPTDIPVLNLALSGSFSGGVQSGLTVFAGESKRFKSLFLLTCAKAYLDAHKDAVMIFYDSEFGTPKAYFESLGIPQDRVFHSPVTTIEQLRTDVANQLEQVNMGDHVFIAVDSVGNLASSKEVNDAKDGSPAADMTRAKVMKSTFRIITPHLTLKGIPCFVVNHTYKSMSAYPVDVVSGGTGIYYSASTIFTIGRRQVKEGTEVTGYDFIINIEKSRFVREKSKLPISVSFDRGVQTYSGIFELGVASGFIKKQSVGWYTMDGVDGKLRAADFLKPEIANVLLSNDEFTSKIESSFSIGNAPLIRDESELEYADEDDHEG